MANPRWRRKDGSFSKHGWFLAVQGQLIQKRGPGMGRQAKRLRKPRKIVWRKKDGTPNPRGTFRLYRGKLIKGRGFRRAAPGDPPVARATPPPPTEPAHSHPERPSGRAGATFSTYFRALGTFGADDSYNPDLINTDAEDWPAPAMWYSNMTTVLGKVKWDGIVPLSTLIDRLNSALQYAGEEINGFDFRRVYPVWTYKYQVVETIGKTPRVIDEASDRRG